MSPGAKVGGRIAELKASLLDDLDSTDTGVARVNELIALALDAAALECDQQESIEADPDVDNWSGSLVAGACATRIRNVAASVRKQARVWLGPSLPERLKAAEHVCVCYDALTTAVADVGPEYVSEHFAAVDAAYLAWVKAKAGAS